VKVSELMLFGAVALAPVYLVGLAFAFKVGVTLLGQGKELQES